MDDPYRRLGVGRHANVKEVKAAYHRLVKIHHPDKGGRREMFVLIQEAYKLLSDPGRKQQFDRGDTRAADEDNTIYQTSDASHQVHLEDQLRWEAMMKSGASMYDFDEWDRAHGLGKYDPTSGTKFIKDYYTELARQRMAARPKQTSQNRHKAFYDRLRERERRSFHTCVRVVSLAFKRK
mmetsp:Transcript_6216/g.9800  ORF Transcript_6216/g.9800 Transcript_6216/m.9800 type:complete len:180 (-) Transcript_6216:3164-3703(-)